MANFFIPINQPTVPPMVHFDPAPAPSTLTPAPTLGGEASDNPKPEPEARTPVKLPSPPNNNNRPGEPEWVTHSGIEGRPYLTEEIYESPDKIELADEDRCKACIDLGRSCVTILKFPNPPALGDLDVCGYCAKDGKKTCGAAKKAYASHLRKQIEDEGKDAISKRLGRRVSKPLSPDTSAIPDRSALSSLPTRRRSLSSDSETSTASAPKRQKMAIRRKKPGPKPRTPKQEAASASTAVTDDKYDGRKDPVKVALRVEKMKATLAAKKAAAAATAAAPQARISPTNTNKRKIFKTQATPKAKAAAMPQTEPKTTAAAKPTSLKQPRSIGNLRARVQVAPQDDFLSKDFVGTARDSAKKTREPAKNIIRAHRKARSSMPQGTTSDVETEVNALLGSIEAPVHGLMDDDEEDDNEDEDDMSGVSNLSDLEAENERLKNSLAKLEAREKKDQLRQENENMKARIAELRRKSINRRESSGAAGL